MLAGGQGQYHIFLTQSLQSPMPPEKVLGREGLRSERGNPFLANSENRGFRTALEEAVAEFYGPIGCKKRGRNLSGKGEKDGVLEAQHRGYEVYGE